MGQQAQTPKMQCETPAPSQVQEGAGVEPTPLTDAILKDSVEPQEPALTQSWLRRAAKYGVPVTYTEEKVELLRQATLVFIGRLNKKLREHGIAEFDLEFPEESMALDLYGDTVTVQWKERDRCGDSEYFTKSMPLSELVDKEVV